MSSSGQASPFWPFSPLAPQTRSSVPWHNDEGAKSSSTTEALMTNMAFLKLQLLHVVSGVSSSLFKSQIHLLLRSGDRSGQVLLPHDAAPDDRQVVLVVPAGVVAQHRVDLGAQPGDGQRTKGKPALLLPTAPDDGQVPLVALAGVVAVPSVKLFYKKKRSEWTAPFSTRLPLGQSSTCSSWMAKEALSPSSRRQQPRGQGLSPDGQGVRRRSDAGGNSSHGRQHRTNSRSVSKSTARHLDTKIA